MYVCAQRTPHTLLARSTRKAKEGEGAASEGMGAAAAAAAAETKGARLSS